MRQAIARDQKPSLFDIVDHHDDIKPDDSTVGRTPRAVSVGPWSNPGPDFCELHMTAIMPIDEPRP
jgi:hypothetical protein